VSEYVFTAWAAVVVVVQVLVVFGVLLRQRREPTATLAWLLAIVFLPLFGLVAFLLFGRRLARSTRRRLAAFEPQLEEALNLAASALGSEGDPIDRLEDSRSEGLVRLAGCESPAWLSGGNEVQILDGAAATYRSFLHAFDEAEHHIHLLFYIFRPDETGDMILDRLVAAARRGVQVRLLVDAMGSSSLSDDRVAPLVEAGGSFARYGPWNLGTMLRRRERFDHRNHRKLVIVDGLVGFAGGINIGREYLGFLDEGDGELWRDTHLRICGPAVPHIQRTFVADWALTTGELPELDRLFPRPSLAGAERVLVAPSGPDQVWTPLRRMLAYAVDHANSRVLITSPYFVPDRPFRDALTSAALRGVDVRLLLPQRSDHWLAGLASLGWYERMIAAGVRIYEYDKGFIHAKTLVLDDWVSTVGSANMDIRSFHLNFELNVFVFGPRFAEALAEQFELDIHELDPVSAADVARWSYGKRTLAGLARLASPLL
jgi:cardiolipin synthase